MDILFHPPVTDAEIIAKMNQNKDNDLLKQIEEAEKQKRQMNSSNHKDYDFCPYCGKKL